MPLFKFFFRHLIINIQDKQLWWSRISLSTKLRLYNTCILLIFLYGSECWAITKEDACRINALHQWCLRMLLGSKWYHFISNDEVRHQTNQPVLMEIIQAWCLSLTLIGHIARMDDNIDAKLLDFLAFCVLEETTRMTAEDLDEDGAE